MLVAIQKPKLPLQKEIALKFKSCNSDMAFTCFKGLKIEQYSDFIILTQKSYLDKLSIAPSHIIQHPIHFVLWLTPSSHLVENMLLAVPGFPLLVLFALLSLQASPFRKLSKPLLSDSCLIHTSGAKADALMSLSNVPLYFVSIPIEIVRIAPTKSYRIRTHRFVLLSLFSITTTAQTF